MLYQKWKSDEKVSIISNCALPLQEIIFINGSCKATYQLSQRKD